MAKTDSIKTDFYINYLTQAQFDALETKEADQIYLTPDASITQITAGDGLSGGGTSGIINLSHSNSVSAKSTLALYPITFDAQGHITNSGNAITVPTITLNGSSTTSPSFYAPTSAGTSGYFLKSNGTGAPTWVSKPTYTASEVGALPSNHTYTTSIAESTGTNQITLGYGKKYSLTAGGTSYIFTMPSADDTNTWRTIQVNGSDILTGGTNTNKLNLKAGTNISLSNSSGTVTINGPNLSSYALKSEIPTVSYPVTSVNSKTGAVSLTYSDVDAAASGHTHTTSLATSTGTSTVTLASAGKYQLTAGGTSVIFTMPTIPTTLPASDVYSWAKASTKPTYTASEVGALSSSTTYVSTVTTTAGTHTTISNKSGAVSFNVPTKTSHLTNDSGFITSYTDTKVTQTPLNGTNSGKNILLAYSLSKSGSTAADTNGVYKATYMTYNDYSPSLTLTNTSDSTKTSTLTSTGFSIKTGSYSVTISANTQTSNHTINLPDKAGTVALTSDIPTSLPASDVYSWAKASSKPSYTASEVGALSSSTTYVSTITTSAGTHSTISSKSGAVSFNVPTKTSHLTNDSGFLTSHQDISGKADKSGVVEFLGNLTSLGSNTPAAATQTYWVDNIANNTVKAAYNTSGNEYSILFSRGGSSNYGSILKWGYSDLYFYIVRKNGSSWRETDWVKMNAGYADSAGSVAWSNVSGTPTIPTKTSQLTNDSGFLTSHQTITSSMVTTALGYTPYNSTNPNGYTNNAGTVTGVKINGTTKSPSSGVVDLGTVLTSHQTAVTSLTTTAGAHSTKSSATGAVSMAVPTKTSHLTNDSSFTTLQAVYPVGAIYISTVETSPATLFGFGTWERIEGQFLLGADSTYTAGKTGGSPYLQEHTHTMSHTHTMAHTHGTGVSTAQYFLITTTTGSPGDMSGPSGTGRHYFYQSNNSSGNYWGHPSATGGSSAANTGAASNATTSNHNQTSGNTDQGNMPPYLAVYMWKRTA